MFQIPTVSIDRHRIARELDALAHFSDVPPPAVTRVVFTDVDLQARAFVKNLCTAAGLIVHEDAIGNTFARWEGTDSSAAAVGTGSHIDAIPHSGRYDGCVGVLGGLEAIRSLQSAGFAPQRSIELILFTSEEPTRFGVGCTGSRAMAGLLDADGLTALVDENGDNYDQVRKAAGFSGALDQLALPTGEYGSFVELHIEQGPHLEAAAIPIGIVTAIAAPATLQIRITGEGGHAGAVLMPDRHDALCAAAEIVLAAESAANSSGAVDTVATTGILDIHPRAINSIPEQATMTVDIRDTDAIRRDRAVADVQAAALLTSQRRGVQMVASILNADPPATADERLVTTIEQVCQSLGVASQRMISRAYHDALFMARLTPMSMIFIPCRGGVSHRPDEFSSTQDIAMGVSVLAQTLARLSVN